MTVSSNTRRAGPLSCNGSVVAFDFDFTCSDDDDIQVILATSAGVETTLTKTTDYTVALNADQANDPGGTVTTVATYAAGYTITVIGALAYSQETALTNLGGFFPTVINAALDKVTILIQQLKETLDRTIRLPASSSASAELPAPSANKAIGWNATADALTNITSLPTGLAVSAFMETVLDDTTAAAARSTLGAMGKAGDSFTGLFAMADRQDVAGAATVDLGVQTTNNIRITGSGATITSFGTTYKGPIFIQFNDVNTLVHNESVAPLLLIPGKCNLTTAAGDRCFVVPAGNNGWSIHNYERADGTCSVLLENTYKALTATCGSNNMTITLAAGTVLQFPDGTTKSLAAAISLTIPDTATLGVTGTSTPCRFWVVALYNSGTPELAVINTWDGTDICSVLPTDTVTTVAIGTGSDSAHVWYSTTLRSSQAIAIVGYVEHTQVTAGTYAASPTKTQGYGRDIPLPGAVVQTRKTSTGAVATGTTVMVFDDTIPQNTEGDEYMTLAITPKAAANLLFVEAAGHIRNGGSNLLAAALFRDSTANAVAATSGHHSPDQANRLSVFHAEKAASTSATTFKYRMGGGGAGTTTFNGTAGARIFGGVYNSYMTITEVMV